MAGDNVDALCRLLQEAYWGWEPAPANVDAVARELLHAGPAHAAWFEGKPVTAVWPSECVRLGAVVRPKLACGFPLLRKMLERVQAALNAHGNNFTVADIGLEQGVAYAPWDPPDRVLVTVTLRWTLRRECLWQRLYFAQDN